MTDQLGISEKYRPQSFDEIIGHENVIESLTDALTLDNPLRVYLISGEFGVGKTTIAKAFIKALKPDPLDIIEENLRFKEDAEKITNLCAYPPLGNCRILILDEFHLLVKAGVDHLLKILEFPPANNWFFLCSSEPDKIKGSINFQRAQHIHLHRLKEPDLFKIIERICEGEGWRIPGPIQEKLVKWCQGSARKLIRGLELCYNKKTVESALAVLQHEDYELYEDNILFELIKNTVNKNNSAQIWKTFSKYIFTNEINPETVRKQMVAYTGAILKSQPLERIGPYIQVIDILSSYNNLEDSKIGKTELITMIGQILNA